MKTSKEYYQIRVSRKAYEELSGRSKDVEYKGRGIVGVVDKVLFGEFTSKGAGRPVGTKKSVDK